MSSSRMYTWPAWSQQAQHVCFVCMNERQNTADLPCLPCIFPHSFACLCPLASRALPTPLWQNAYSHCYPECTLLLARPALKRKPLTLHEEEWGSTGYTSIVGYLISYVASIKKILCGCGYIQVTTY